MGIVLPVAILGTGSVRPGRPHTTEEVLAAVGEAGDPSRLREKMGIDTRYWMEEGDSPSVYAAQAVRQALDMAGLAPTDLKRLIFVTSGGGEFLTPATANAVVDHLGLNNRCDGFDVNNACMGFLTAFDLAARCVATGLGPVAVAVVETMSWFIKPEDPRPYLVLGDAVAAAVFGEAPPGGGGVLASVGLNDGSQRQWVGMLHPSRTGKPELMRFGRTHSDISAVALDAMKTGAALALEKAGLGVKDIDWFLPHQPNGSILDRVVRHLGIGEDRYCRVVDRIGSVVATAIPMSLDVLMRSGRVRPGQTMLMFSVGGGMAYGAIVYRVPPPAG
ncbi:MAG: ketoacyl-ACP synthase III [Deltaproteobacteria bacterium]|nr:ketoacyl-ACP synthase III [Deltaproteobacteria bacterium]